jgi:hypothetical protein
VLAPKGALECGSLLPLSSLAPSIAFVRDRKLHGRGVGWIDVHLLASALVARLELWTPRLSLPDGRID